MNGPILQLLVLAAIAVFLILRLRNVLGTRDGFEPPPLPKPGEARGTRPELDVIQGGQDRDIIDHVAEGSASAAALAAMKAADRDFSVGEFLHGAKSAYEMILMAFERGDLASIRPFISDEVHEAFEEVLAERQKQGLTVEANFTGVSDLALRNAEYDPATGEAEVTVGFTGEMTWAVRDRAGDIVDGSPTGIRRQRDAWTFARRMTSEDPNWQLVATGE